MRRRVTQRFTGIGRSIAGCVLTSVILMGMVACGPEIGEPQPEEEAVSHRFSDLREMVLTDTVGIYSADLPMPDSPVVRLKVNHFGSYAHAFADSNYVHMEAALQTGIDPLTDTRSHWNLRRPIVKIVSCQDYYVEDLTHSVPFLVPEAAHMLHDIGSRFNDTLMARGGGKYRIRVSSILRTPEGVKRLRRRNVNAVDSSVHQMGTTVDISYARFVPSADNDVVRSIDDLKGVLAEILHDMRAENKCYVKFERKQPCFHITVRPGVYPQE